MPASALSRIGATLLAAGACATAWAGDLGARAPGGIALVESADWQAVPSSWRAGTIDDFEADVVALINDYRRRFHLPQLRLAGELDAIAARNSERMARERRMSHDGFLLRFEDADSRVCVENLGTGFTRPDYLVERWKASPKHMRNLLDPALQRVGVAKVRRFVTFFACS